MGRSKKGLLILSFLVVAIATQAQLRIDRYLINGRQQLAQKQYAEALQTFSRIILTQDDNWEAWYYRGLTKFYLGDEAGSELDFNKAISLQPNLPELYMYRGIVKDFRGEYYGALEDFNKGLELEPNDPVLRYSRGTTYLRLNNFTKSIEDFDIAVEKDPRMHNAYLNRGIAKAKLLRRDEAFSDFNEAIMLKPFSGEGHQRKGLLHYETGNYKEAIVSFSEALIKDPDNTQSLYARALTWSEIDRKDSCLNDLTRVIKLDPFNAVAIYNRAIVRAQLGDIDGAVDDYSQVNKLHPNHILTYFNRGILWHQKGEFDGAIADLSEAIRLYPDFAKAYMVRSSVYKTLGKTAEAQKDQIRAQEKIIANQGKTQGELALNYADTTIQFEELISLNSQFMRSFSMIAGQMNGEKFDPVGFFQMNGKGQILGGDGKLSDEYSRITLFQNYPEFDPETWGSFDGINKSGNLAREKRFNEAIELLGGFITKNEFKAPSLFMRALIKFEMIDFVMNTGVLNEVVPLTLGEEQSNASGGFSGQIDYTDILDDYSSLLKICPEMTTAWYNRGLVKLYSEDFKGAESDFSKAVELDPEFKEAWYNRGMVRLYADEKKMDIMGSKIDGCLDFSRAGELGLERAYGVIKEMCGNN